LFLNTCCTLTTTRLFLLPEDIFRMDRFLQATCPQRGPFVVVASHYPWRSELGSPKTFAVSLFVFLCFRLALPYTQNAWLVRSFFVCMLVLSSGAALYPNAFRFCLPLAPALETAAFLNEFNWKSMLFRFRPLPGAASRSPRRWKPLLFFMNLIKNRYFFGSGRSRAPHPARPGAGNQYFSQWIQLKTITFPVPAAHPGTASRLPPALEIDIFLDTFDKKWYFSGPGRSRALPPARPGNRKRYCSWWI